jgi:acetolactate synthase-1/2/3 large subunit
MKKTKLSDYVAAFLAEQGIRHVFIISGGASIHLLHSVAENPDIAHICPHHEQAGAMAADAYARVTGNLGCAIGTSGPGATNMITGIAGAWFDSIPCLYITGQVTTFRMKGDTGVRQLGFQETEIIPMVEPITKYAVQISSTGDIRYELEKAVQIAKSGRPGPVVVDIPDDLQREFVDVDDLRGFDCSQMPEPLAADATDLDAVVTMLSEAERPVLMLGWGIRLSGGDALAQQLIDRLGIPVLTSWAARDLVDSRFEHLVGTVGTHGTRAGNFAMQNADLVLCIGSRLSTRETGSPMNSWAREARTIVVDVDESELRKFPRFGKPLDMAVHADAKQFISGLLDKLANFRAQDISSWRARIEDWKSRYVVCQASAHEETSVNPYAFVEALSGIMPDDEQIFIDTGCSVAWMMQGFGVRRGQRLYHDFNNTAMGWALPAAIGGCLALEGAPVTCVSGDGSLMMNLQELATIKRHRLPVRLFVLNNGGYSMVQQTQEQWLGGEHVGTSIEGGLDFPDFAQIAKAFDIPCISIDTNAAIADALGQMMALEGPVLIDVRIPSEKRVEPQSKFGYPIEDAEPLLPRDEFLSNMIVAPMPKSLEPLD